MQNANVSFDFEGRIVKIQCSTDDKMKDICQKYANKIERNVNSLIFLYGGSNLNYQLSFKEQANIIDRERNEMSVLVYKNENELSCPKCGEKINLNSDKINDIKTSINNINDTIKGLKFSIENIIKISSEEAVKFQLKNMNPVFNDVNEDIKKLNKKFDDLLNVTNINKELNLDTNYIIAEINIKDKDINKDIKILGSYEEFIRAYPDADKNDNYKNEDEIKQCEIKINDEIIPFNYYHQFKSKGKYIIKYSFKNNLKSTFCLFGECKSLTKINLSNFNTNNTICMARMFYVC
jgi:surface protein